MGQKNIDKVIIQQKLKDKQDNQKKFYDQNAKDLTLLSIGDKVIFEKNNKWEKGTVKSVCNERLSKEKNSNLVFNFTVSENSKRIYDFSDE